MTRTEEIKQMVAKRQDRLNALNDEIWNYAELYFREEKSSAALIRMLKEEGFEVEEQVDGMDTAFIGTWGSGRPVIGILGEFDALPSLSQKAACPVHEEITPGGNGHGCGHCALGTAALGAAAAAKEYMEKHQIQGTIKYFGCPAEEAGWGKMFLARDGYFDGLDAIYTWHPGTANMIWSAGCLANVCAYFTFKGKTAHAAASPHLGRSALDACELMNVGVNYLREHIISTARVHYAYLDCGGDAPNIVQGHASLLYFVRAPRLALCDEILGRIKKIAQGAALMTETDVKITVLGGLSDNIPNPTASTLLSDAFIAEGGPDFGEEEFAIARKFLAAMSEEDRAKALAAGAKINGISEEEFAKRPLNTAVIPYSEKFRETLSTGSTDVGDVSYLVPTAQFTAAVGVPGTGAHTWQFAAQVGTSIGDKASVAIARAIAYASAMVYENPSLTEQAKKELLDETHGKYVSPIPDGVKPGEGM